MTVIARFEVLPTGDGHTSERIANALQVLDRYPVTYETTATDTIIEADSVEDVFAAAAAAHRAIPDHRVITSLQVDEVRDREQHIGDRVQSVEQALGRPPRRIRHPITSQQGQSQQVSGQQTVAQQSHAQPVAGQQRRPQQVAGQQGYGQPTAGQQGQFQQATGQQGQTVSSVPGQSAAGNPTGTQ